MNKLAAALLGASTLGAAGLLHTSGNAMASGFALRENSAVGMGTAFAGAASAAADLSTIFNNPAGMTRFSGSQADVVGTLIYPSIHFEGTARRVTGTTTGGGDGGDAGVAFPVPALYGLFDASPDLKFGVAVTAPFGLKTRYNSDWVGRYHGINTSILTVDVNPNVAYKVSDWLSVGGGISGQYLKADQDQAVNLSLFGFPDARARVTGDSYGVGVNFGLLFEPLQNTRVGATYRSRVHHSIEGDADFAVPAGVPGPLVTALGLRNTGARTGLTLPDSATLSVTHDLTPRLSLMSDLQWTHWSTFKNLNITRPDESAIGATQFEFKDTIFAAVGAAFKLDEHITLRSGVAFDQSPVTNEFRTVRLPDEDRVLLTFGLSYAFGEAFQVDAGYLHLFVKNPSLDQSINNKTATGDVISGAYRVHADMLSLAARLRF